MVVELDAGITHSIVLLSYQISKAFLSSRYISLWTNHYDRLISSWQFCRHKGTFTLLASAMHVTYWDFVEVNNFAPIFFSGCALPKCYRKLMAREMSKTQPFCPNLTDGKRFFWNVSCSSILSLMQLINKLV